MTETETETEPRCVDCGAPLRVPKRGPMPKRCGEHARARRAALAADRAWRARRCACGCGEHPGRHYYLPGHRQAPARSGAGGTDPRAGGVSAPLVPPRRDVGGVSA